MNRFIFLLFILICFFFPEQTKSQPYFTSTGPSYITVPFGSETAQATFYFTYNLDGTNMVVPKLAIMLDGQTLAGALCQGGSSYLPSSYTFSLSPGSHTIKFTLQSLGEYEPCQESAIVWQQNQHTVYANFKIRVENNPPGGFIYVDNIQRSSPYDRTATPNDNFPIGAIDQTIGSSYYIWNSSGTNNSEWQIQPWQSYPQLYSYDRNTSYSVQSNDRNMSLIAKLKKVCSINFENYFEGVGNGGVIKVNGQQYNSPKTDVSVIEQNPVTAEAMYQVINGIEYSFVIWSTGSTNSITTFYPGSSTTYSAEYFGRPHNSYRNLSFSTSVDQPITLYWNEHPNTNVTNYQIYRRVKHNGVMGDPSLLATINRGVGTYTDYAYLLTSTYSHDLIYYDVRAYYSVEGTYANGDFVPVFGRLDNGAKIAASGSEIIPTENKLFENYPNPFNPSTQIEYAIKEDGFVTLKVYDVLGNEITTLVNEQKESGYYRAEFNAAILPSGVYIYSINVHNSVSGGFSASKKMILAK